MNTVLNIPSTKPISIPRQNEVSYRDLIKQLAAQTTTKPYGDIPPLRKKKRQKKEAKDVTTKPIRRMSHVEDWIVVDSKESLPDEQDLVQSPFINFLSGDFLTDVLPLHVPPPSLSEIHSREQDKKTSHTDTELSLELLDQDESEEEAISSKSWKDDNGYRTFSQIVRRHSVSSFQSGSTTIASYPISSSPPQLANTDSEVWKATLAKLKKSLFITPAPPPKKLIPMPPPPKRPSSHKRRSEATTKPRFNPDTDTYLRDTRYNPDHLRMISAELNMIRNRKLLSPLKPRGFLPRRKDPFVRGQFRKTSPLLNEIVVNPS